MASLVTTPEAVTGTGSTPWTPDLAIDTRDIPAPRIEKCPPFYLQAHRNRWGVLGGKVLPILAKLPIQVGVAGVFESKGKLSVRSAIATREENGWTVLPHDIDGPGTNYVNKVDGLAAYVTRWETVYSGSSEIVVDTEGYYAWLENLVNTGKLPACPKYALDRLTSSTEQALLKAQDLARTMPSALPKVERLAADLAVLKKAQGGTKPVAGKKTPMSLDTLEK